MFWHKRLDFYSSAHTKSIISMIIITNIAIQPSIIDKKNLIIIVVNENALNIFDNHFHPKGTPAKKIDAINPYMPNPAYEKISPKTNHATNAITTSLINLNIASFFIFFSS